MRDKRFRDRLADAFVVERDVVVRLALRDRTIVGDDLHALLVREGDQRGGGGGVDGIEHDDLRALSDDRVELLLLLGRVGVGVLIEHLAIRAELLHLGDETGVIMFFVAGRALVGHQEGDRSAGRGMAETVPARKKPAASAAPRASREDDLRAFMDVSSFCWFLDR